MATTTTGIHAVLLRASSGELAWEGKHCGGRMGEPAGIVWQHDSKGFFFAFVSGVMSIHQVCLREESASGFAEEQTRAVGTLPDFGWDGVGVFNGSKAITAVSDADLRPVWATEVGAASGSVHPAHRGPELLSLSGAPGLPSVTSRSLRSFHQTEYEPLQLIVARL
ncbi:hypothetical protein Poly30_44210 [Planctomycetes bacterium Poly30]|uniref:Uncharacterized protein n=1 Tax=Saltatorellus ferox TaxID=2528018 RepID=A0A518EXN7_9BACT|nr:hypothetical protein Poly30_44210 [Planctomycetes bacterium Poly30]